MTSGRDNKLPNGNKISDERRSILQNSYEQNLALGKAPYADVQITTLDELLWILQERKWSGEYYLEEDKRRANLSGMSFQEVDLQGVQLVRANLSRCIFRYAKLNHSNLIEANISNANFTGADLSFVNLLDANMKKSILNQADLSNAILVGVNFSRTKLIGANFSHANLREAKMDDDTDLAEIIIDSFTLFGDIKWANANLTRVDWTQAYEIGDEALISQERNRVGRIRACRDAALAYHGLAIALKNQGLNDSASHYRVCEYRMNRQALFFERRWGRYLFEHLLNALAARGEKPERALIAYILVNAFFSGIYWELGQYHLTMQPLPSWDSPIILSLTSFHGRVFFAGGLQITDWAARVGAIEAAIGLLIEIVFIATFSRRFLGD